MGKRGFIISLVSLSTFIVPYLFLLSNLVNVNEVFSVGAVMAVVSILFLWVIAAVFRCIGKTRKLAALGISFLLTIPSLFIINVVLSRMIAEPILDIWDMLSVFILLISAFICDYARQKGLMK